MPRDPRPGPASAADRGLLLLEEQGANRFFGEPALDLNDLMQTDPNGRGLINVLAADRLMRSIDGPILFRPVESGRMSRAISPSRKQISP